MQKQSYRPTFYLTINSLFILFILTVGCVLAWHNYRDTKEIVLVKADQEYDQILNAFTREFQETYSSVFDTVRLLSKTGIMTAANLEQRLEQLDLLSIAVENMPEVSGLQVGYDNGDYLIVRFISSDWVRDSFAAPEGAAFIFDNIAADPETGLKSLERIFYDKRLTEILRQPAEPTEFDPRTRPWYLRATETNQVSAVEPYLFYFSKVIGTTVSFQPAGSHAVIAADVTLGQLSATLSEYLLTPSSEIALVTAEGFALGYSKSKNTVVSQADGEAKIAHIGELGSEVFSFIDSNELLHSGPLNFNFMGKQWHGASQPFRVNSSSGRDLMLVMVSPHDELLADTIDMTRKSLLITLGILLLSLPFALMVSGRVSKSLAKLSEEAGRVSRFDFDQPVTLRSRIKEVDELSQAMRLMKNTISRFLALLQSLAKEQNFDAMLEQITDETLNISESAAAMMWFVDDTTGRLQPATFYSKDQGKIDLDGLPAYAFETEHILTRAARENEVGHIDLKKQSHADLSRIFDALGMDTIAATVFPLKNRKMEAIGLLCLFNVPNVEPDKKNDMGGRVAFVKTFSGFASVSLESRYLLEMQKRLMDSFMQLLAGAIDAKSPYTGGHCQRVPVLAKMLAKAACQDDGFFKDFQLDEDGWEALHLAGWLHDCGKVTTPEYVVDKSTKLETLYDRIHEVRTRFEVLKRDVEIQYWQQVAEGGDGHALREALERQLQELDEDFTFVAECNLGDEFISPEKIERLENVAKRTWMRTLDDRLGISWEEENRKARSQQKQLPVEEYLLADRIDHLIERTKDEQIPEDNPWGFKITVPEHRYNKGELYNLKVGRGTLTPEERYKISDHVVQTIIMLNKLPYPKHLKDVPAIAGGHHETMDGKGYPKKLTKEQMSVPARIMAVADIFEALTASDRPYKKAKKLSEAIRVMSFFRDDQHIDRDLFELFLRSGAYLDYAHEYLDPEQIDEVDIESYLS